MLTGKDYCDYETCVALKELGFDEKCYGYYGPLKRCFNTTSIKHNWCNSEVDDIGVIICPTLYEAQKWLREEKGIHIAPRIYLYHDINLDEQTSWECTIYVEWSAIYTIGKSLTYEDALLLGIKEAVKILKEK
jgi:hypothetical protein